jgi:transposase
VARCLEGLGHEVIVGDHNFAPMYATRTRKVKTDRRDARALRDACVVGAYRPRIGCPIPSGMCAAA